MTPPTGESALLAVRDLAVSFESTTGTVSNAVDGVSFTLYPRQTVAIVGESGCGKSVTAMSLLRLLRSPPARYRAGTAMFADGGKVQDLLALPEHELRGIRGARIAMVFQEPMTSLNPVMTVGAQIAEAVRLHRQVSRREAHLAAIDAMRRVEIPDAAHRAGAYPHEFSGGMRQRVMIAMALACRPAVLLADEPTTALDVTVQAQILDLIECMRDDLGMGVLLITHDLGVVASRADVVCVMYAGRVVEYADVFSIFRRPLHPYTRGLLASIPSARVQRLRTVRDLLGDSRERTIQTDRGTVQAWWPDDTPASSAGPATKRNGVLIEAHPGHWALAGAAPHQAASHPDVRLRRGRTLVCADKGASPS